MTRGAINIFWTYHNPSGWNSSCLWFFQILCKKHLSKLLITMTMAFFPTSFLPTTIFLLSTFPLNNAACPWVRYCYNVINTFSTGDDLPVCNTRWHIFCTLNTSWLRATMKLKNLLPVIQSNLPFFLYILHSSFFSTTCDRSTFGCVLCGWVQYAPAMGRPTPMIVSWQGWDFQISLSLFKTKENTGHLQT